jgi:hypothetical protein
MAVLLAIGTLPITAHHSVSAVFDMQKKIKLSGELLDVDWVNPHIQLRMKSKNANGVVETWRVEGGPPSWYRRVGVNKSTFSKRIGESITIDGLPAKDGTTYGFLQRVTFANGDTMESASAAEISGNAK